TAEASALAWDNLRARTDNGLIHVDLSGTPDELVRRRVRIGDRDIGMGGCAPDLFGIAAVLDVPFQVEDTCAATGAPIRIDFVPGGVEHVDPPDTVVSVISPEEIRGSFAMPPEEVNTVICSQMRFFASRRAARDWLVEHPGGRVLAVHELLGMDIFTGFRNTLRPLIEAV
ncbi:MAG: organomercurial lyase, partial [Actinomycetes bacterium]